LISWNRHPARLRTVPYFRLSKFAAASRIPAPTPERWNQAERIKLLPIFWEKLDDTNESV
jgi:hypothetical protein